MKPALPLKTYFSLHFSVAAVLPVITIACLVWLFIMPTIKNRAKIQHQAVARSIAGQISTYLQGGERQLTALAAYLKKLKKRPDSGLADLLDTQCGDGEFFETLFIIDDKNTVIQSVGLAPSRRSNRSDFIGLDLSGRSFIDTAKAEDRASWSKTFLSTVSSRMAVALTLPMEKGFLIGEITLTKLSRFIRRLPVESGYQTMVLDRQGQVIADSRNLHWGMVPDVHFSDKKTGEEIPESLSKQFELDNEDMLGALVEMDTAGWKVLVAQPARKAFQPLRDTFRLIAYGLAVALILAISISWGLAGRFSGLYESYTKAAESIARGEYSPQWPSVKTGEFARMSTSLKRMADKIRQRENALVDSERLLKNLTANVPGVVYQFRPTRNLNYQFEFIGENARNVFALEPNPETFAHEFNNCIPDDEKQRFENAVKHAVNRVEPWNFEGRFIKPGGEEIWFSGNAVPQKEGEDVVFYGVLMDITRRKEMESLRIQAEKALRDSEQLLNNILESMNEGILVLDHKFRYTIFNKTMEAITNTPRKKVIGRRPWDVFPYVKNSPIEENQKKAMAGKTAGSVEIRSYLPDKPNSWTRDSFSPVKDAEGLIVGVVGVVSDISRQKQDEEELRRLRNYLSNIIDSMPSVLVGVDRQGMVTQWNRRAEEVTGVRSEEAFSQPLNKVFPQLMQTMERIQVSIRERRVLRESKIPHGHQGETRYEDVTIYPLVGNSVEGAVIRMDDVTEKINMEEMMIQTEKMLSVGGLAAGMAHEINNPLAGMIQNANLIKSRLTNTDMPANLRVAEKLGISTKDITAFMKKRDIFNMIDAIQNSGLRAAGIINSMLSFARKSAAEFSSHHPGRLMDRILELAATDYDLKKQYDFKSIEIIKEYEDDLPMLFCEGAKLQQVFLNILRNGAQAMQAAKTTSPRFTLRIYSEKTPSTICMEIEDNGPGMDEAIRSKIFNPFFTTKPVGVGTGLGLSVSYFIITENHHGTMEVVSEPGKGATFIIRLPAEREKPQKMISGKNKPRQISRPSHRQHSGSQNQIAPQLPQGHQAQEKPEVDS